MLAGLEYAGASAFLSGSFAVFPKHAMNKAAAQQRIPLPPPVTAWWLALGFVCASAAVCPWVSQAWSWWALLSGLLWALATMGRVACIQACGMCIGNATPDVTTVIAAWMYDALCNHQQFSCPLLGRVGLCLLALCIVSLYVLQQQGVWRKQLLARLAQLTAGQLEAGDRGHAAATAEAGSHAAQQAAAVGAATHDQMHCPLLPARHHGQSKHEDSSVELWGLLFGVTSGVCSGLGQLPFKLAKPPGGSMHLLLSSSLGMLLFASLNVLLHRLLWHRDLVAAVKNIHLHASLLAPWGLCGGVVLLGGTAFGILATGDGGVNFAVAKVLAGASILVSGAWGVLLFHELQSLLQVLFWLLSLQMLCAYAVILTAGVVSC